MDAMEGIEEPKTFEDVEMYIPNKDAMDEAVPTSRLFQVPLTPEDVRWFVSPTTQPREDPMNCAIVSTRLIGLITHVQCEGLTELHPQGMTTPQIKRLIQRVNKSFKFAHTTHLREVATFVTIDAELFDGFATLIFLKYADEVGGHVFVLAKYQTQLYVLDPQSREVHTGATAIRNYFYKIAHGEPTEVYVLVNSAAFTREDLMNFYLPRKLTGRSRKRKTRSKRLRKRKTRRLTPSF